MKKIIPFFIALFVLLAIASCEKDPDSDKLENGNFISTDYAQGTTFSSYSTYYLPDSILFSGTSAGNNDTTYVNNSSAMTVINAIATQMAAKGFQRTTSKTSADLGLQVTFTQNTYTYGIFGRPWYGSDYWGPGYWGGGWSNWYYPFVITYSYNTGSLLIDMIDLNATADTQGKPIIWNAYISSLVNPSSSFNPTTLSQGVQQAFEQSPYLSE